VDYQVGDNNYMIRATCPLLLACLLFGLAGPIYAQPETMGWGNVTGIRIDGHLFEVNSSMCVVRPDWSGAFRTAMERQTNNYSRNGKVETVKITSQARAGAAASGPNASYAFSAVQSVEDTGVGTAKIDLEYTFPAATEMAGAYLCLTLPSSVYSAGRMQLIDPVETEPAVGAAARGGPARGGQANEMSLAPRTRDQNEYVRAKASGVRFISRTQQLEVTFAQPSEVVVRDDRRENNFDLQVYLGVLSGSAAEKQSARNTFNLKVAGEIDKAPAEVAIEASRPGPLYAGFGGNFRLQNPKTDPAVIQYNLDNMRVVYARVEMPWSTWHPNEAVDPLEAARAGQVPDAVDKAMSMAKTLALKGMPVIVSDWSPPAWAVVGGQGRGGFLNPAKMDKIKGSLASYLVFLKEKYGVEAVAFSFNESDIGINVWQTDREHMELLKTMGPYFASRGLATKLLLGDTGDARPHSFIKMAMQDPEAMRWVHAVSFHSWRGCTPENLKAWSDAARALNVPLLVAEGSTDAAAWRYPLIFQEQSFALREIELYTRILAIAQPKSILQWQLTADYSLLAGGGVFNDNGVLRPTQRFWNMKQLASIPPNMFYLPAKCGTPGLTCAAFGDIAAGVYAVHVVNTGAARPTTLSGLPAEVKQLRVWVTDGQRGMVEGTPIPVAGGKAQFTLDQTSFTTLISAN
jgi:hypothetical protein